MPKVLSVVLGFLASTYPSKLALMGDPNDPSIFMFHLSGCDLVCNMLVFQIGLRHVLWVKHG